MNRVLIRKNRYVHNRPALVLAGVSSAAMASIIPLRDGQVTAIDETAVLTPVLR